MSIIRWLFRNWAVVGLLGFVVAFFFDRQNTNLMHERAKFTVGIIDGWHYTAKSGRFFNFTFPLADTIYGGSSGRKAYMNEANGSRYLVEYDSLHPEVNVGHFDVPIPDSLRAPANGWRVPPVRVPVWFLDHGKDGK